MSTDKNPWLAIRVDGDQTIGTGHVMRCLSLATEALKRGFQVRLLARSLDANLASRISNAGIEPHSLTATSETSEHRYAHSDWLAVAEDSDAAECLNKLTLLSEKYGTPALVIVDHYALAGPWHELLRTLAPVLAIDELGDRPMSPDWLIDQTVGKSHENYSGLIPEHTQCLIGGQYALLRAEFAEQAASLNMQRPDVASPLKILITMGGVDACDASGLALDALELLAMQLPVEATVVIGSANPHHLKLQQQLKSVSFPARLIVDSPHMSQLMADSHLAIGAAGTSAWERCAVGLPALNLVLADNQETICTWLAKTGAALHMGRAEFVEGKELADTVYRIATNPEVYRNMVQAAFAVADGQGCQRVLNAVLTKP
jgi:UDP-2,4-diacetamido-2,4,6-trideoxy-beta-L-altropyranose hydrolase